MSFRPVQVLAIIKVARLYRVPSLIATNARFFATTLIRPIGRSPRVRDLEWAKKRQTRQPAQTDDSERWPIAILDAAHEKGGLKVSSARAVQILDGFQKVGRRPNEKDVQQLCQKWGIRPLTLTMLAYVLLRSGPQHSTIAKDLMVAASKRSDSAATLQLMSEAIKIQNHRHPDVAFARQHLADMAKAGNPKALTLMGQIRESESSYEKALRFYESAARVDGSTGISTESSDGTLADAWSGIARLKAIAGDWAGSKAALEKAALQYDDPSAYYGLAQQYTSLTSPNWLNYILKAAISGDAAAANKLGRYYLGHTLAVHPLAEIGKGFTGSTSSRLSSESLTMATEWFTVSAESSIVTSQLYLAILLRAQGQTQEGLNWLTKAGSDKQLADAISYYRQHWHNEHYNFLWRSDHSEEENEYCLRTLVARWAEQHEKKLAK